MAELRLATLEDTLKFGALLARLLPSGGTRALLLRGGLGSGKTTLTAALARSLPGGEDAEVSSPSFTLCNIYPTRPQLVHCDLYRCPGHAPEELTEALEDAEKLVVVEWADYLPAALLPEDFLDISIKMEEDDRLLLLRGAGPHAGTLPATLVSAMADSGIRRCEPPERDRRLPHAAKTPRNG